jgi:hypothetical protein
MLQKLRHALTGKITDDAVEEQGDAGEREGKERAAC